MITEFKIFELINNDKLVRSTINDTLKKILKINGESLKLKKTRNDKLNLEIEFEILNNFKKEVNIMIDKLKDQLKKSGTFLTYKTHDRHQMKFKDEETFEFEIDKESPILTEYRLYVKDTHFNRLKPPRYLYHMTSHNNYESIMKNGLEIRGNEVYSDSPQFNHPKAIYASSKKDFFGYSQDDEWRIDTSKIKNKWWRDYNIYDEDTQKQSFLTYEPIPIEALELIKGQE